jgi:hypothetical protein
MAKAKKRGSLKSNASLKKTLTSLKKTIRKTEEDLRKLVKGGKKAKRKAKAGSYAKHAKRDRYGRLLPKSGRRKARTYLSPAAAAARMQQKLARKAKNYFSPAAGAARIRARAGTPVIAVVAAPSAPAPAPSAATPKVVTTKEYMSMLSKFGRVKGKRPSKTFR